MNECGGAFGPFNMIFLYIYIMADNFPNEELEIDLYYSIAQADLDNLKNHIERRGRDVNEEIYFFDLDDFYEVGNKKIQGFPTPLQVALIYENYKIAAYLLNKGADPNVYNKDIIFYDGDQEGGDPEPLYIALYYDKSPNQNPRINVPIAGSNRKFIKLLLNKGAKATNILDDYVDEYFKHKDGNVEVELPSEEVRTLLDNINFIIDNIRGDATRLEDSFIKAHNKNDEGLIQKLLTKRRNINFDIVAKKINDRTVTCMSSADFNEYCDEKNEDGEVIDPITLAPLSIENAVILPGQGDNEEERKRRGKCYDREALLRWVRENPINPLTREAISNDWIKKNLEKPCVPPRLLQYVPIINQKDPEIDRAISDYTNSIINTLDTPGAGLLRDILSTRGNFGNYGGKKKRKSLKKKRKTKRKKSLKKKQRKTKRKSRK